MCRNLSCGSQRYRCCCSGVDILVWKHEIDITFGGGVQGEDDIDASNFIHLPLFGICLVFDALANSTTNS